MKRFLPIVSFVCFIGVLAVLLLMRPAVESGQPVAAPLPALSLKSLNGTTPWKQESLRGQVTLINFFASWCVPCAAEMPEVANIKKEFPTLKLLGVAWNDDPSTLNPWLVKNHNPFHSVWTDPNGDATIALGIRGIPETMIVDAQGRVRYRLMGPITPAVRSGAIDPLLRDLLAEAARGQ